MHGECRPYFYMCLLGQLKIIFEHWHKVLKVTSLHVSCGENCLQTASLKQMQSLWNTLWSYLRPQRPCFSLKKKNLSNITVEWLYVFLTHCGQITAGEADWIWASAAKNLWAEGGLYGRQEGGDWSLWFGFSAASWLSHSKKWQSLAYGG